MRVAACAHSAGAMVRVDEQARTSDARLVMPGGVRSSMPPTAPTCRNVERRARVWRVVRASSGAACR